MDWRSLTQVKEFGIYFPNAPTVAAELVKVFEQYWILGTTNAVPATWPASLETKYTIESPMAITMNGTDVRAWPHRAQLIVATPCPHAVAPCAPPPTVPPGTQSELFFSLSPPPCQPASWSLDSTAITTAMFAAEDFIWIEVMDYMPALVYVEPSVYWNTIDNAIRKASYKYACQGCLSAACAAALHARACRALSSCASQSWVLTPVVARSNKTEVRLLIGYWEHSMPLQQNYVQSLNALPNVTVKYFIVPRTSCRRLRTCRACACHD